MFAKWIEDYQKLSQKTRFLSQLAAFLISIFAALSLYDWVQMYFEHPKWVYEFREMSELFSISLVFQLSIFIVFTSRFISLLFESEKTFWLSKFLYLIGFILFFSYWYISKPAETTFEIYSTYPEIFRFTSRSFDVLGYLYLIFSPFLQIMNLYFATIRIFVKKEV